jgi:acyl-CoA reductase-like NAD-dependent aldehyde dehydrogenase
MQTANVLHRISIVGSMSATSFPVTPIPLAGSSWSGNGPVIEVRSPFDGSLIGAVPLCGASEVDRAVSVARDALKSPLPLWRRAAILDQAAVRLAARREEFARTIAAEAAKPIRTARVEVDRAVGTFQFAAAEARKLSGEVIPLDALSAGEGKFGFTLRVPIGVVGAIAPFNFPLNLVVHKVGPAIAAGCPVVLKPASQTPLSSVMLADMLIGECGLPPEWLHVVTGGGSSVGNALVDHPDVALITFTGSPDVGWGIRARAPKKRVGLELGNNAPVIIEPSGDWRTAATKIRLAGFSHAGQSCISTQRIYVHRTVAEEFIAELIAQVSTLVVGDPMDEATEVSALISLGERDRVQAWIDEATAAGAKVLLGGDLDANGVLRPTVLADVEPDMKVSACEVFGPLVTVSVYDDVDEALRLANDSDFGLQAAIFTADIGVALKAVRTLDYGGVLVNEVPTWRADQQPYGGVRDSGNTREGPAYSVREMTEIRMVVLGA